MRGSVCHIPSMSDCYKEGTQKVPLSKSQCKALISEATEAHRSFKSQIVVTKWQQAQAPALKLEPYGVLEERYMLDSQPIPLATAG